MKKNEKYINNLSNLVIMNAEVEKIYEALIDKVFDDELKFFFKEKGVERHNFVTELKQEIARLGGTYVENSREHTEFYKFCKNIRTIILFNDGEDSLVREVRELQELTINKYNDLLKMLGLPLSICKLLSKQRDMIQEAKDSIDRQDLVAFA